MKICPKCGKTQKNAMHIECKNCNEFFIEGTNFVRHLEPDTVKAVALSVVKSWRFWLLFIIGLVSISIPIWKALDIAVKHRAVELFNSTMTNQIKTQFQEPRISNIFVSITAQEATNLINRVILPKVSAFETNVDQRMQDIEGRLARLPSDIFSSGMSETFRLSDTNRVAVKTFTNGVQMVFFVLAYVPQKGSLSGIQQTAINQQPVIGLKHSKNIAFTFFGAGLQGEFTLNYFSNLQETNKWSKVELVGEQILFDGIPVNLPQP